MVKTKNPWEYVQPPDVTGNRFIHPPSPPPPSSGAGAGSGGTSPAAVEKRESYVVLHNLRCVDAEGRVFEEYPELHIATDVVRQAGGTHQSFTPYNAILHFQTQPSGLFLPSMALSCNIVAALFHAAVQKTGTWYRVIDAGLKTILDQYKNHGAGWGWQAQNTLVDYNGQRIIHYPTKEDFPSNGGATDINASPRDRRELPFKKSQRGLLGVSATTLDRGELEDKLANPLVERFVRNYSGLENPHVLIDIGTYFEKPAYVWFPDKVTRCTDTRAAWLGCGSNNFNLYARDDLCNTGAARGVRR